MSIEPISILFDNTITYLRQDFGSVPILIPWYLTFLVWSLVILSYFSTPVSKTIIVNLANKVNLITIFILYAIRQKFIKYNNLLFKCKHNIPTQYNK